MLREVISQTPRNFGEMEENTIPSQLMKKEEMKDNSSDAATKKRVEVSNLGIITPSSSSSSQLFQNNSSFQRFSLMQFNNMMESKDFGVLLQLSEKAIKYREKTENKLIKKMIDCQKYSPRVVQARQVQLETWVNKEKEEISKTKNNLLEKWNQTKEVLEQTEQNAKIIKQQIGSLDWSRKAIHNFASPISEQDLNSIGLQSYREDKDTERKSADDDKDFGQSQSEHLNSNSAISLRISVLSNKSEDVNFNKTSIDIYKLQRTKDMNRLSTLMAEDMPEERKNQSETFYVGNVFKRLLEEDDMDAMKHQMPDPENIKKIFEYQPQKEEVDHTSEDKDNTQNIKTQEMLNLDLPNNEQYDNQEDILDDIVVGPDKLSEKDNSSSDFQPIQHMKTSSNENLGVRKVDDMSIEQLLLGDDQEELSHHDEFDSIENQFSKQVDQKFIEDFQNETHTPRSEDLVLPEDQIDSDRSQSNKIEEVKEFSHQLLDEDIDNSFDDSPKAESEENIDIMKPKVPQLNIEGIRHNNESNNMTLTPPVQNSSFSPQNLVTKLLNSLNKNSTQSQKSNDMLI